MKQRHGERKSLPNVKLCSFFFFGCCLNPGIDRPVLILYSDICLKVAFDLNFNLQTVATKKDYPFVFSSIIKCLVPVLQYTITDRELHLFFSPPSSGNIAVANICLGETTKEELLLLPRGETFFFSLRRGAQAAWTAFRENNSLAWLKTPFKDIQELIKVIISGSHIKVLSKLS